ncbi:MAG: hypothetical protein EAX95_08000 [Candidatus Thorarchaeota archaeon]|nr:hypothetical protein [Candidatus Thorarchaeota archaeon]
MTTITYHSQEREDSSVRPVRLDRTEGHVIIEGRAYPARELVEALAQSGYAELRAMGDSLVLGRKKITPIFKSRQERAMAALCHGSLAFCCPMSKRCAERNRALEMLGLTPADYEQMKGEAHLRFIEMAKGHLRETRSYEPLGHRTANRPAVDYGYGRDDYRREFDDLESSLSREERSPEDRRSPWAPDSDIRSTRARAEYGERERSDPYSDLGSLFGERSGPDIEIPTPERTCKTCSDENIEGLGSLFSQGELSPFSSDHRDVQEERGFCFSCGRTFRAGTKVCPWCGITQ